MGVDAVFFVEVAHGEVYTAADLVDRAGWELVEPGPPDCRPSGATHRVSLNGARYFGPGYYRGPWPEIAAGLMLLMRSPSILNVWYFSDSSSDYEKEPPFRLEQLLMNTEDFVLHPEYSETWPGA